MEGLISIAVLVLCIWGIRKLCIWIYNQVWKMYWNASHGNSGGSNSSKKKTVSSIYENMPADAHGQVEALAQLVSFVYKKAPYAVNNYAKGNLYIYKGDTGDFGLKFWYDWDYSAAKSIIEKQYRLGKGFSFRDDGWVEYKSARVADFERWCKNRITNAYDFDPIIATLQNNCPGLYIKQQTKYGEGIHLEFSFKQ